MVNGDVIYYIDNALKHDGVADQKEINMPACLPTPDIIFL